MASPRASRRVTADVAWGVMAFAGLLVVGNAGRAAAMLELEPMPWASRLFVIGMVCAFIALLFTGAIVVTQRIEESEREEREPDGDDRSR